MPFGMCMICHTYSVVFLIFRKFQLSSVFINTCSWSKCLFCLKVSTLVVSIFVGRCARLSVSSTCGIRCYATTISTILCGVTAASIGRFWFVWFGTYRFGSDLRQKIPSLHGSVQFGSVQFGSAHLSCSRPFYVRFGSVWFQFGSVWFEETEPNRTASSNSLQLACAKGVARNRRLAVHTPNRENYCERLQLIRRNSLLGIDTCRPLFFVHAIRIRHSGGICNVR